MPNQTHIWRALFALTLIGGAAWLWIARADPDSPPVAPAPREGAPAPPFTAQLLEGDAVSLADYAGQVVVLNLWASWCGPCRAEMPDLERIWRRYHDDGLVILALNQSESPATIAAFRADHDLTFPIALDPRGEIGATYYLAAYPTTFFIGRDGVIRKIIYGGPMPEALIEDTIHDLLNE